MSSSRSGSAGGGLMARLVAALLAPPTHSDERRAARAWPWLCGLVLVTICNGLWWSSRIQFDDAPDEADHYMVQEFVARTGRLPVYGEERFVVMLMDSRTHERFLEPSSYARVLAAGHRCEQRQPYLFTPQMPYWLGGQFARLLGGPSVAKARLASTLWIALGALCVALTGLLVWPGRPRRAATAGLLFALWPQVSFVGAYVNDDAFAVAAACALVLGIVAVERRGPGLGTLALLGLGVAATAGAKYYDFALFPLLGVWALWHARRRGLRFLAAIALPTLAGLALAVPWFTRNARLYDGDPLGMHWLAGHLQEAARTLPPELRAKTNLLHAPAADRGVSLGALWERGWLSWMARSFWGCFGWMSREISPWLYATVALVLPATFVLPRLRPAAQLPDEDPAGPYLAPSLFAFPLLALLLALSLYNTFAVDYQAQGRYLLAACGPLVLVALQGMDRVEAALARRAERLLVGFFVVQNLLASLFYVH